jgi:wobble nucleotide-excising tRNase
MLERFDTVKKVGLFDSYTHHPAGVFGEITLIYGENGVGKSTLAAILDSLRDRNAGEIIRRRSLPGTVAPSVSIRLNGNDYTFDGSDWNAQPPHDTLDVFYPGFVTRNVHAVNAVDPDHRRHLCELVLGRKAVEHVARLTQVDDEGRAALGELRSIEKELVLLIKRPDTLETFLGLPIDANIDDQIDKVRAELKQAQSMDAILLRAVPARVALPTVDRSAVASPLERSAAGIGADVASVIRSHISTRLDDGGEKWLEYGATHLGADGRCPFCAQALAGSHLVESIRSYFSAEYRSHTELLTIELQTIRAKLGTAAFAPMRTAFLAQVAVATQWADELPIDQAAIAAMLSEAEVIWSAAAKKLGVVIAAKRSKPLDRIDPASADDAIAEYESALGTLAKVNEILSASAKRAIDRKTALSTANTAEIEQRLRRLENQKARFEPLAQDLLGKRNALIEKRTKLDNEKTALKTDIGKHASGVVSKYQAGINHYLEHFGCDIRVEAIEPKFPSGKASIQYTLKAHGHEIDLGVSVDGPSFETVLSEGDKYTLALSFFFARLKDHADLSGRTVVLDDPVNSLGSSRRTLIEGVVRDLRTRGAQVIVLTHDERLAAMIWRDKKLKAIVPLQVERTNKGSQLVPWDVDRATRSEYVSHYLVLQDFLEHGGDHTRAAACIRPYLEQRLRHLFPGPPFQTRDTFGQMIAKVRDSASGSRLSALQAKVQDLEAINDASLPGHHATDDVPGMAPLTSEGVRLFAQKALDVLG